MGLSQWITLALYKPPDFGRNMDMGSCDQPMTQVSLAEAQPVVTSLGRYPSVNMAGKDVPNGDVTFDRSPLTLMYADSPPSKNARSSQSGTQANTPQINTVNLAKRQAANGAKKGPYEWRTVYDDL